MEKTVIQLILVKLQTVARMQSVMLVYAVVQLGSLVPDKANMDVMTSTNVRLERTTVMQMPNAKIPMAVSHANVPMDIRVMVIHVILMMLMNVRIKLTTVTSTRLVSILKLVSIAFVIRDTKVTVSHAPSLTNLSMSAISMLTTATPMPSALINTRDLPVNVIRVMKVMAIRVQCHTDQ